MDNTWQRALFVIVAISFAGTGVGSANAHHDCLTSVRCAILKIAGTGDDPPGVVGSITSFKIATGDFPSLQGAPAVDGFPRVLFTGESADGKEGVFIGNELSPGVITFAKVADSDTDPPGIVHTPFLGFYGLSLSDSFFGLAYWGRDSLGRRGVFERDGLVGSVTNDRAVVSWLDPVPGTNFLFNSPHYPTLGGRLSLFLAFTADWLENGQFPAGVFQYALVVNPLFGSANRVRIARAGDDPPGPVGPLVGFPEPPSTNGSHLAFTSCDATFKCGIFLADVYPTSELYDVTKLEPVVSTGDLLPLHPVVSFGGEKIHTKKTDTTEATNIVLSHTQDMNENWLVFEARSEKDGNFLDGVYIRKLTKSKNQKEKQPTIKKVVTTWDEFPGAYRTFTFFDGVAINSAEAVLGHEADVVFSARDLDKNQGLFLNLNGETHLLLDSSMELQGKRIKHLSFTKEGFRYPYIAFGIAFTDGTQGIYRIELKEQ